MDKIYHVKDINIQSIELYDWTIDHIHIVINSLLRKSININQIKMKYIATRWHIINKQDLPQK